MGKIGYRIANTLVHLGVWLTTVLLFAFWRKIPAEIPTHYNGSGEITDWGGKGMLIMLVIFLFVIYGTHLICLKVIGYMTTAEKTYGKKLAPFVNEEDLAAGILMTKAYLAWTDATVILLFSYIIFCSAACITSGGWLTWAIFILIAAELGWYMAALSKQKRLIKARAAEAACGDDGTGTGARSGRIGEEVLRDDTGADYRGDSFDASYLGRRFREDGEEPTFGDIEEPTEKKIDDM